MRLAIIVLIVALLAAVGVGAAYFVFAPVPEPVEAVPAEQPAAAAAQTGTDDAPPTVFVPVKDRTRASQIDRGSISLDKPNFRKIKAPERDLPVEDETTSP